LLFVEPCPALIRHEHGYSTRDEARRIAANIDKQKRNLFSFRSDSFVPLPKRWSIDIEQQRPA
jgi:hypothetical protein